MSIGDLSDKPEYQRSRIRTKKAILPNSSGMCYMSIFQHDTIDFDSLEWIWRLIFDSLLMPLSAIQMLECQVPPFLRCTIVFRIEPRTATSMESPWEHKKLNKSSSKTTWMKALPFCWLPPPFHAIEANWRIPYTRSNLPFGLPTQLRDQNVDLSMLVSFLLNCKLT